MALEHGLGRGLGALLGDAALQTPSEGALMLAISEVQPGLNQPRKRFDEESLENLAESIRMHGIIQPLTVRRLSSGGYQIIAGERRWRAAKLAGLEEVPAVVVEADDRTVMELGLIENLQREDLNPIEEAIGYKTLIEQFGLTQEEVARRVGKARPSISNAIRLLDLPDAVRELLEESKLSAGHARALLMLPNRSLQRELAQRVVEEGLSVRQTEASARRMAKEKKAPSAAEDSSRLYRDEAAQNLSNRFGRRVIITHGAKKGKIELEYYDDNDLKRLLDLLNQIQSAPKGGPAP